MAVDLTVSRAIKTETGHMITWAVKEGKAVAALCLAHGWLAYIKSASIPLNLFFCSSVLHFYSPSTSYIKQQSHLLQSIRHSTNQASTMKAFAISTFLFLLATKLNAAPANNARQAAEVTITFEGAADASFTLVEPADGSTFWIGT